MKGVIQYPRWPMPKSAEHEQLDRPNVLHDVSEEIQPDVAEQITAEDGDNIGFRNSLQRHLRRPSERRYIPRPDHDNM